FVAGADVHHFLVVEQVEHRQPRLQVDIVDRQGPGDVRADVVGPRHAAEGAALGALVHAVLPSVGHAVLVVAGAAGHAQPAGTAAAALAGEAGNREVLVGPGDAERRYRAARHGCHRAA